MSLRERIGVDIGRKLPLEEAVAWATDQYKQSVAKVQG